MIDSRVAGIWGVSNDERAGAISKDNVLFRIDPPSPGTIFKFRMPLELALDTMLGSPYRREPSTKWFSFAVREPTTSSSTASVTLKREKALSFKDLLQYLPRAVFPYLLSREPSTAPPCQLSRIGLQVSASVNRLIRDQAYKIDPRRFLIFHKRWHWGHLVIRECIPN